MGVQLILLAPLETFNLTSGKQFLHKLKIIQSKLCKYIRCDKGGGVVVVYCEFKNLSQWLKLSWGKVYLNVCGALACEETTQRRCIICNYLRGLWERCWKYKQQVKAGDVSSHMYARCCKMFTHSAGRITRKPSVLKVDFVRIYQRQHVGLLLNLLETVGHGQINLLGGHTANVNMSGMELPGLRIFNSWQLSTINSNWNEAQRNGLMFLFLILYKTHIMSRYSKMSYLRLNDWLGWGHLLQITGFPFTDYDIVLFV